MTSQYKVMCGCKCCIYTKIVHSSLLSWRKRFLEKTKDKSLNAKNRRYVEMPNRYFEIYKKTVMSHGKHMFHTSSDITMAIICACPSLKYASPHWKCFFSWCVQYLWIDLPSPESDRKISNVGLTIRFHIYQQIACCNVHGRRPFNENKQCQLCEASTDANSTAQIYTRK